MKIYKINNKMSYTDVIYSVLVCFLGLCFTSCTKMNAHYDELLEDGEIIYTAKADSVQVYPGKERAGLYFILSSGSRLSYYTIYWNEGKDSMVYPINKNSNNDTFYTVINDLAEGYYDFSIYTGDDAGHRSIQVQASGRVYGEKYQSSLQNRAVVSARWIDGFTTLTWQQANIGLAGINLRYTDTLGKEIQRYIPPNEDTTRIKDLKKGSSIEYQSLYLPDSAAIDTFYTDYTALTPVFEGQLDKSLFRKLILSGDALTAYGWVMPHLWDGGLDEGYGFFCRGSAFPISYTFDMGQTAKLTRFKVWQRGVISAGGYLYAGDNASKWEVWGRADAPPMDGSWNGWVKLMTCQSVKPSGSAPGSVSDIDKAYALEGEEFIFPDTIPKVRYIRIKVLETWGQGAPQINTMEMTFWERVEQ